MADQYDLVNAAFSSKSSSKGMSRKDLARKILIDANYTGPLTAPTTKKSDKKGSGPSESGWGGLSNAQKVFATLLTPLRGVLGASAYITGNQNSSDNIFDAARDSIMLEQGAMQSGQELTSKLLPSLPTTYTAALGLGADIGLDPLTYVPGAAIIKPLQKVGIISKSTKGAGTFVEEAAKVASKGKPRPSLDAAAARIDELNNVPSPVSVSDQLALESGAYDKVPGINGEPVWLPKSSATGPAIPINNPIEPSFGREAGGQLTAFPKSRFGKAPKAPAVADEVVDTAVDQDALFNFLPTATKNPTLVPNIGAIPGKIKKVKPGETPVTPVAEVPKPKPVKPAKSPAEAVKQEAKAASEAAQVDEFVPPHDVNVMDVLAFKGKNLPKLIETPAPTGTVKYGRPPKPAELTVEQQARMAQVAALGKAERFAAPYSANAAANGKVVSYGNVASAAQWDELHRLYKSGNWTGPRVAQILFAKRSGEVLADSPVPAAHVYDFISRLGLDPEKAAALTAKVELLAAQKDTTKLGALLEGAYKDAVIVNDKAKAAFGKSVETKVVGAKTATPALDTVDADLAALGLADNMPVTPAALPDVAKAVDNAVADAAAPTARTSKAKTKEVLEVAAKVEATKTSVKEATKRELADAADAATVAKVTEKRLEEIAKAPGTKNQPIKPLYNGPKQGNSFNDLLLGAAERIGIRFDRTTSRFAQRWSYQLIADTIKNLKVVEANMADAGFIAVGKKAGGTELRLSDVLETIMDNVANDLIKLNQGMYKGIHNDMAERVRLLISKDGEHSLTLPQILDDIVSHRFGATKPYNISADTYVGQMIRSGEFDALVNMGREKAATTAQLASEGTLKALDQLEGAVSNPAFVVAESQAPKAAEKIATQEAGQAAGDLAKSNTKRVLETTPVAPSDSAARAAAVAARDSGKTGYRAGTTAAKDNVKTMERGKATTKQETGMTPEQINNANVNLPDNQLTETTIMGRVGSWVAAKEGWASTRALVSRARSTTQSMSRHIAQVLNNIERTYTPTEIKQGWLVATGAAESVPNSAATTLGTQFRSHMENLFGSSGIGSDIAIKGITVNKSGVTMDEVNRWLGFSGIDPEKFSFGSKMIDPITGEAQVLENGWHAWEHVNLEALKMSPTEFLSRIEMATTNALTRKSVYEDLIVQFGSKSGGPGLVKYVGAEKRLQGIYFPKEITGSIDKMNKFIGDLEQGVQSAMLRNYDELLRLWKSGVTIYSPGHHVRNMIGDTWLSAMSGMNIANIRTWKQGRLIQNAGRDYYKDLKDISILSDPEFYTKVMTGLSQEGKEGIKLANGKFLTYEQIYFQAQRDGLLPHAAILEDLPTTAHGGNMLGKLPPKIAKPTGGRASRTARRVSEGREHYVRLSHYADLLKKSSNKNKTTAQILEDAAFAVKKHHPDGSDLTKFERDVMRRLIPFYSWQRKAIPLIIEGAVRNPARTMVYPKALYNFQIAMGIESPSPYDPFPNDQLFPDWISDMAIGPLLGEADNYWGALTGSNPLVDTLNTFVNNPARGVAESITPFISVPYEVLSGNKFSNPDIKTGDRTAAIDAAIPGVSHLGRMTNTQPFTGGLEALMTGDSSKIQGKYGPTEGNTNAVALINYLTGLGLFDMSRPNYIRGAKLEDQQQISDARKAAIANG